MDENEKVIMQRAEKMLGYSPVGMLDLLHVLAHPDVIDLTWQYLAER